MFRDDCLPKDIDTVKLEGVRLGEEIPLPKLLHMCGLVPSISEAKRLIESGAVRVDEKRVEDVSATVRVQEGIVLRVGKRRVCRISLD